jgi:hypothetical protein
MRRALKLAGLLAALLAPTAALAQPNPTLDVSQSTTIATGSTVARKLADRQAEVVNVADYADLPTALASLTTGGAIVRLARNTTYVLTAAQTVTRFNTVIECPNWGTVIQRGPALLGVMLTISGDQSEIRGCTIDGNGTNHSVSNAELSVSGAYARITNNRFINSYARSIAVTGDYDIVNRNAIIGMGPTDTTLQTYGIWALNYKRGIIIADNEISNTGIDAIGVNGQGTIVRGNHIWNCHCLSTGPLVTGGGQIGTYPGAVVNVTAATWAATSGGQATLTTSAAHGILAAEYFVIDGMTPAAWNGVYVAASITSGTVLVANRTVNPGTATAMGTLTTDKANGVVIDGNTIDQGCNTLSDGIEVNTRHTVVSNNTLRNQKGIGINLDVLARYTDITGNTISNGNQVAQVTPPVGAVNIKDGVQHVTITGGSLTDDQSMPTQYHAIRIGKGVDYVAVNDVNMTGNLLEAIHNESVTGTNIRFGTANLTDTTNATPTAGRLYAYPFWISQSSPGIVKALTATIAATTGGSARLGIYADNGLATAPGNKLYDSGILPVSALGALSPGAISVTLGCTQCYVWIVSAWSATATPSVAAQPVNALRNPFAAQYSATYTDTTLATALPASFGAVTVGAVVNPSIAVGF